MHIIEEFDVNGYHVEIVYDECPWNPRDDATHFLFLGFPNRRYDIGDQTVDPERMQFECEKCECTGYLLNAEQDRVDCPNCEGCGYIDVKNMADIVRWVTIEYDALQVELVGMIDHSGTSYYLGGGHAVGDSAGWDSGTCGLIVYTKAQREMWGTPDDMLGDGIREMMDAEIDEYSCWASGDVQNFRVFDMTGREVEIDEEHYPYYGTDGRGHYHAEIAARECVAQLPGPDAQRLEWALAWV